MCGENLTHRLTAISDLGSSPRVRGKRGLTWNQLPLGRLIPACAGKTGVKIRYSTFRPAHPRVCGENSLGNVEAVRRSGSSPRVRGKRTNRQALFPAHGLIPACAGKTSVLIASFNIAGAHPRVCGENKSDGQGLGCPWGSSPRVRGKRARSTESIT